MYVSMIFVRVVLAELELRGIAPSRALDGTGIHDSALSEVGSRVSIEQLERVLAHAAILSKDPAFGLHLGQRVPGTALQVLSFVLLSSSTLRQAIDGLLKHAAYVTGGVHWDLREHGGLAYLSYCEGVPPSLGSQVAADAVLAVAARALLRFTQCAPEQIWFRHDPPSYQAEYLRVFDCPIRFHETTNAMVFARGLLDVRQPHGDPSTLNLLHDVAARLFDRPNRVRMSDRVRVLLRDDELRSPDYERLARRLGMSRRNLRRRLAEEGACLTTLVDEARFRAACEALRVLPLRIRDTSERLGYSEPSAFHRAFKRWTGKTPRQFSDELSRRPPLPLDGFHADGVALHARGAVSPGVRR